MPRGRDVGRRDRLPTDTLAGVHVLVVDDDFDSRALLTMVLEYSGALVTVAASARDALTILERVTPDVLVSDIAMPREDGYWLLREVRRLPPDGSGAIPAVAITAHSDEHGPDRTLRAGFQAHLTKPIDPWEICRTIASLTRRA
jgi:CheY-like chemotaxis protein